MGPRSRNWTLLGALRHHVLLLIATVGVSVAVAGLAAVVRPPIYQGTALLVVDERYNSTQGFDLALQAGELQSAHYVQIATSRPVLVQACQLFSAAGHKCNTEDLARQVSANTLNGASTIAVNARDPSPGNAAELANDVSIALLNNNRTEVDRLVKPTADHLDAELKQLSQQIAGEQAAVAALEVDPSPGARVQAATHQTQLSLLQGQYSSAYQKREDLLFTQYRLEGSISLFQPATATGRPVDPNPPLYLAAGLVVGLLAGLFGVLLLERFDERLYGVDDLVDATGVAIGLALPEGERESGPGQPGRYYALARAHLLARHPDLRNLLVAAASDRDEARPVAAGLGAAALRAGQRVLVVDAEHQAPPGFTAPADVVSHALTVDKSFRGHRVRRPLKPVRHSSELSFMALADDGSYQSAVGDSGSYDLTVMAAPSPYSNPAGIYLARTADAAVLVATAHSTTFAEARRAAEALRRAGIEVVAGILIGGRETRRAREAWLEAEQVLPASELEGSWLSGWRGPA